TVEFFLISRAPDRAKRRLPPRFAKPHGRRIPNWVKETVYTRDGGRCTFRSPEGTRCEARGGLEYDHVVPWAHGGVSNDPKNVRLLCRTHNVLEAERVFGPRTTP
ncbi:MAG: HNH endonuclease, partial [Elusimicrobia bacterium]|nr:HNH endonuclease [Elusimicrobiota bacterium]